MYIFIIFNQTWTWNAVMELSSTGDQFEAWLTPYNLI